MGYEICDPGVWHGVVPLKPGQATLMKCGKLTLHDADLASIGAGQRVIVLADRDTWRIAVRACREDELARATPVTVVNSKKTKKPRGLSQVNVTQALRRLDVTAAGAAGRYKLDKHGQGKAALLAICLTSGKVEAEAERARETAKGSEPTKGK